MNNPPRGGLFICAVILFLLFVGLGIVVERSRIERKCLVEMQEKPHKEAIEICTERVK